VYTIVRVLWVQMSHHHMLLGHTFVFGDIDLCRNKPKNCKQNLNLGFFQPWLLLQTTEVMYGLSISGNFADLELS